MPDLEANVNPAPCDSVFPFESRPTAGMVSGMKRLLLAILLGTLPLQASEIWSTNYNESLQKAASQNRMVLLEFTGSDWCPPCKKQAKDVFEKPSFEEFAKDNLVPVKLDFPRRSEQSAETKAANQALAQKYNIDGFPTLILLDSKGTELAREVGYGGGGVEAFIAWVNKYKK